MRSGLYDDIVGDSGNSGTGLYDDIVSPSKPNAKQPKSLGGSLGDLPPVNPPKYELRPTDPVTPKAPYKYGVTLADAKFKNPSVDRGARLAENLSQLSQKSQRNMEGILGNFGSWLSGLGIQNTINEPEGMKDAQFLSYFNPVTGVAQVPGQMAGLASTAMTRGVGQAGADLLHGINFLEPGIDDKERLKRLAMAALATHGAVEGVRGIRDAALARSVEGEFKGSGVSGTKAVRDARILAKAKNMESGPIRGAIKNAVQKVYSPDLRGMATDEAISQTIPKVPSRMDELDAILSKVGGTDRGQRFTDNNPTSIPAADQIETKITPPSITESDAVGKPEFKLPGEKGQVDQHKWNVLQGKKRLQQLRSDSPHIEDVFGDEFDRALATTVHNEVVNPGSNVHHEAIDEPHLAAIRDHLNSDKSGIKHPVDDLDRLAGMVENIKSYTRTGGAKTPVYDNVSGQRRSVDVVAVSPEEAGALDLIHYALQHANEELRYLSPDDIFRYNEMRNPKYSAGKSNADAARGRAKWEQGRMAFRGGLTESEYLQKEFGGMTSNEDLFHDSKTGTNSTVYIRTPVIRQYLKDLQASLKQHGLEDALHQRAVRLAPENALGLHDEALYDLAEKYVAKRHETGQGDFPMPDWMKSDGNGVRAEQTPDFSIPKTRDVPDVAPKAAQPPNPDLIGISNARQAEAIARGELPSEPEKGTVYAAGELANDAKNTTFQDGQEIAANIRAHVEDPSTAFTAQNVAKVQQATKAATETLRNLKEKVKTAYDEGKTSVAESFASQLDAHIQSMARMAGDLQKGKTHWHNLGVAMQGAIDLNTGDWTSVLQEATKVKKSKLSPDVASKLTEHAETIARLTQENDALKAKRTTNPAQGPRTRDVVRTERQAIVDKLKNTNLFEKSGVPKSRQSGAVSVPKIDPQAAALMRELARNLKEEFFDMPLEGIVKKIQEHFPGLSEEDVLAHLTHRATRGDETLTPLERANEYHRGRIDKEIRAMIRDQAPKSAGEKVAEGRRTLMLASPVPTAKILASSVGRLADQPAVEAAGIGLRKLPIVRDIFKLSPHEGHGSIKGEFKALVKGLPHGIKEATQQAFNGYGELQAKYNLEGNQAGLQGFIARILHDVPKTPAVVSDFYRRVESSYAHMHEVDPQALKDPAVQDWLNSEAWTYAQRAKYRTPNAINDAINAAANKGGAIGKTAKILAFPFGEIPTNIAFEKIERKFGVPLALAKTGEVLSRGMKELTPETKGYINRVSKAWNEGLKTVTPQEADLIARLFKRGTVGAAKRAFGYYVAGHVIGQYYAEHQKNASHVALKEGTKYGDLELFGMHIPHYIAEHVPALTDFLDGAHARIRQQANAQGESTIGAGQAWGETVAKDVMDIPAWAYAVNSAEAVRKGETAQYAIRQLTPAPLKYIAGAADEFHNPTDRPFIERFAKPGQQRKPMNAKEEAKMSIPNLLGVAKRYTRESVPVTDESIKPSIILRSQKREDRTIQKAKQKEDSR